MSPDPLWDLGNILYDSTALPSVTYYVSQCEELIGIGMSWYDSEFRRVGTSLTKDKAEQEIDLSKIKA
jgi:hypothetical protein